MNLESSKSTKGLAIYDLFGYHASRASVSAAILDFEKCSRVNSIYPTDYVYGISRTSKSVEKKTISIKSGFSLKITFGCLTIWSAVSFKSPKSAYNCACTFRNSVWTFMKNMCTFTIVRALLPIVRAFLPIVRALLEKCTHIRTYETNGTA